MQFYLADFFLSSKLVGMNRTARNISSNSLESNPAGKQASSAADFTVEIVIKNCELAEPFFPLSAACANAPVRICLDLPLRPARMCHLAFPRQVSPRSAANHDAQRVTERRATFAVAKTVGERVRRKQLIPFLWPVPRVWEHMSAVR